MEDFNSTRVPYPLNFGALLAFSSNNKFELCEFQAGNFQPLFKTEHCGTSQWEAGKQFATHFSV